MQLIVAAVYDRRKRDKFGVTRQWQFQKLDLRRFSIKFCAVSRS